MGVRIASSANNTIVAAAPANGVETIILQTGALGLALDNAQVLISWFALVSVGAGATSISLRLRRGAAVSSPLINVSTGVTVTASTTALISGCYSDLPGIAAGLQYSFAVTVNGGAAAGSILDGSIAAIVL